MSMIIDLISESSAIIKVDTATAFQSLQQKNSYLSRYNISLEIGLINNKDKNPIAKNAIKEVRTEWLRLIPEGKSLSECELALVTATINKRIRSNNLTLREILLKRSLFDNKDIQVEDKSESENQHKRRVQSNEATKL